MDPFVSDAVIGLLILVVGLLGVIGVRSTRPTMISLDPKIEEKIKELGNIVRDHMDIQAIRALVAELEQQPDISAQLASYGNEKINAVLIREMSTLADTINHLNDSIANQQRAIAEALDPAAMAAEREPSIIALVDQRDDAQARFNEIMEFIEKRVAA